MKNQNGSAKHEQETQLEGATGSGGLARWLPAWAVGGGRALPPLRACGPAADAGHGRRHSNARLVRRRESLR